MDDSKYISGIYNYCDRWCDRCDFTDKCEIYDPDEVGDFSPLDSQFFESLEEVLQQTLDLLQDQLDEEELDEWESMLKNAAAFDADEDYKIEQHELTQLSREYFQSGHEWLEEHQSALEELENELNHKHQLGIDISPQAEHITDALEVIQWYLFFVSAKVERALRGLKEDWGFKPPALQSDANGSAKIALLAIERSLVAWETIRGNLPQTTDDMLPVLIVLAKLRHGLQQLFPNAQKFIRPGFDERGVRVSDN